MTTPRLITTFPVLALLALVAGCHSGTVRPRALPRQLLATPSAGRHQMQLNGLSSLGAASSAVGPSDLLDVYVVTGLEEGEDKPIRVRVDEQGVVQIPYIGPVAVAGVEPDAAAVRIAQAAVERGVYRQPQINVAVAKQATHRVTILGAVAEPGVHEVPRTACDILTAVAAAGGFSEEAGTVVEVLRHDAPQFTGYADQGAAPDGGVRPVSFEAPAAASPRTQSFDLAHLDPKVLTDQRLNDRDVIVVRPKAKRVVHVSGLVSKPDQFELPDDYDLRVLDAIAMAGGTTTPIADKVFVIRQAPDESGPVVVAISIRDAKKDGAENLLLQSGDLVSVEATVATTVVDTFTDLFRMTMGVGGNLTLF